MSLTVGIRSKEEAKVINGVSALSNDSSGEAAGESVQNQVAYRHAYHELSDHRLNEAAVIERLKSNIAQLEDLHARLRFMMSEISYLMKKR